MLIPAYLVILLMHRALLAKRVFTVLGSPFSWFSLSGAAVPAKLGTNRKCTMNIPRSDFKAALLQGGSKSQAA